MTLTIDMPDVLERRLTTKAREAGLDVGTFALRVLQAEAVRPSLDDALAPAREAFARSGITDDELADLYESQKHAARGVAVGE